MTPAILSTKSSSKSTWWTKVHSSDLPNLVIFILCLSRTRTISGTSFSSTSWNKKQSNSGRWWQKWRGIPKKKWIRVHGPNSGWPGWTIWHFPGLSNVWIAYTHYSRMLHRIGMRPRHGVLVFPQQLWTSCSISGSLSIEGRQCYEHTW